MKKSDTMPNKTSTMTDEELLDLASKKLEGRILFPRKVEAAKKTLEKIESLR